MPDNEKNAQKMREYIFGLPTKKERIMALIHMHQYDTAGMPLSDEEFTEYHKIISEVLMPIEESPEKVTPKDIEDFKDTLKILTEIKVEIYNQQLVEQLRWKDHLKETDPELTEEELEEQAKLHAYMTGESNWYKSVVPMFQGSIYQSDRKDILFDELSKDPMYREHYEERMFYQKLQAGKEDEEIELTDLEQLSGGKAVREHLGIENEEILEKVNPLAVELTKEYQLADHEDAVQKAGLDEKKVKDIAVWMDCQKTISHGKPWKSEKENSEEKIKAYTSFQHKTLSVEELRSKGQSLVSLRDHMKTHMKAVFYDSDEYINMMRALDTVQSCLDRFGESPDLADQNQFNRALAKVSKACGVYVNSHITNRSTDKGKDRFDAAMAAIAIVDTSRAKAVGDVVNQVRRKENDKQLVDIDRLAEKFHIDSLDRGLNYEMAKKQKELTINAKKSDTELIYQEVNAVSDKILGNIFGEDQESRQKAADELGKAGVNCQMKLQHILERAAWNIVGYYTYTHPKARGLTLGELSKQPDFKNAYRDYKQFLQDNALVKTIDYKKMETVPLPKEQVEKGLENLAKYHHYMFTSILDEKSFPDLTSVKNRSKVYGKCNDLNLSSINISQNVENLIKHQDPSFFDYYPGGSRQYSKDVDAFMAMGSLAKAVLHVDNPKKSLQDRLAAAIQLQQIKDMTAGKTPAEITSNPEFAKNMAAGNMVYAIYAARFVKENTDQKTACQDYLIGKAGMPEKLKTFLRNNQASIQQDIQTFYETFTAENQMKFAEYEQSKEKSAEKIKDKSDVKSEVSDVKSEVSDAKSEVSDTKSEVSEVKSGVRRVRFHEFEQYHLSKHPHGVKHNASFNKSKVDAHKKPAFKKMSIEEYNKEKETLSKKSHSKSQGMSL